MVERCECSCKAPAVALLTNCHDQYDGSRYSESSRDRNRLCIEDPFEVNYNVARTVTKDGLYTVSSDLTFRTTPKHSCRFEENLCEPPGFLVNAELWAV